MIPVPAPSVTVFAVEDTSAQIVWRALQPGRLRLTPALGNGALGHATEVEVDRHPGAVVLTGLPSGTRVEIQASGTALPRPMVLHATTLEPLPGEELCRVAAISDLHLGALAFGHRNTITEMPTPAVAHPERCAAAAMDAATTWGAERLLVKGDITHHGQVDQWRVFARLARRCTIPIDTTPGNHDRAFRSPEHGLSPEDASLVFGLSNAEPVLIRDLPGLRIVLADTTTDHYNRGQVTGVRAAILDAVSEAPRDGSVLIALHHQLQRHVLPEGWPIGINHHDSVQFLDRLAGLQQRVLVTSGHTHRHRRWDHRGVIATQVGSTKDYPGVWAGYVVHEGGLRQVVNRVSQPDCLAWTDHTRRAALGTWRWVAPGRLNSRCFNFTEVQTDTR